MSKQMPYRGEVIGLAVMLLMIVAVVAAQADASVRGGLVHGEPHPGGLVVNSAKTSPDARLRAVIDLNDLTIAIDASAKIASRGSLARGN